jgi:hypothetical protein
VRTNHAVPSGTVTAREARGISDEQIKVKVRAILNLVINVYELMKLM